MKHLVFVVIEKSTNTHSIERNFCLLPHPNFVINWIKKLGWSLIGNCAEADFLCHRPWSLSLSGQELQSYSINFAFRPPKVTQIHFAALYFYYLFIVNPSCSLSLNPENNIIILLYSFFLKKIINYILLSSLNAPFIGLFLKKKKKN